MFSYYQWPEDYEDELYGEGKDDDDDDEDSEPNSDLEFHLYSQLHYRTEDLENRPEKRDENQGSSGHETPQEPRAGRRVQPPAAPPDEVILIDSGSEIITLSDNTEEDDSVCAWKGQRSKGKGGAPVSQPQHLCQKSEAVHEEVVVLDSESDQSSDSDRSSDPESVLPYVMAPDSDSDSDSDGLESWMVLGQEKEEGDRDIQLNVFPFHTTNQPEFGSFRGDVKNWAVSNKDKQALICNKVGSSRRTPNRYYTNKTVTCRNCDKLGHLSKNCPAPKKLLCCSLCGIQGHFVKSCPNRHCSNCALPGHTYDDCLERAYWQKRCRRCAMTGHSGDACPDIWRQYHLTTTAGPPVKSPRPAARRSPAYCYNCSGKGHFGHECAERRMFNRTYPTLPFTSSYDTQHDITSRAHRVRLQAEELKKAGLLVQAGDAPTPQSPRKKWKNAHFRSTPQRRNGQSWSTPQQPWKKAKNAHLLSAPIPQTPDPRTPKRRIAHTPKQPPQGIHTQWHEDTRTNTPQLAGKRKYKKQKRNASNGEPDFPRGFRKDPRDEGARFRTPPHRGRKSPGTLFGSEKSKKKNKEEEWERKENLFMIKQRKRRR